MTVKTAELEALKIFPIFLCFSQMGLISSMLACEQALWGALAVGGREGELLTTSLEFEYLRRKSRYEMLIGGDDISNDVTTLGTCLNMFFNVCLHSPCPIPTLG